ncbi:MULTISPECIES: antiholin-like murein hydrolase modulator LrgA [Bacillaceae]|mgnify:CR=1 FL=1|uniref:Antiholin-like protein LrgA n=5 Tax=Bacillus subtilis TaxID=1423 RepID=LRGA_BACSU|nr:MULTISPECIES: antiholin-like murein hydrolase modulator LrgA [Bacillales]NP_390769.1 pyruvate uptake system subunit A [Bacillus subtilis subsp. subtilis str. 168]P94515.1 RecName: Full=Antiholin-like protein LrgA [Bacillus subtilis subsp. subtilis str. 168]MBL3636709.1 antiholin-like murein hydrolase modulator LrgA [Alkalicoccobacillus gibsonii]MDP4123144.1 antiholin-like murein hydrolase modulator LrgA [Bacillota bacterium]WJD91393.1 antiholin-like murein hydrolase modulator LrgA [Bacillus
MSAKKVYGFLTQAFIFAVIMLVSNMIAAIVPIPIPASVVGLVLLFLLLCLKVIKLEQVETLGTSLTSLIGFLFVPSGISVMNSLGVMQQYGLQIVLVILLATIILLGATGLFSQLILSLSGKRKTEADMKTKTVQSPQNNNELVHH